MDWDPLDIKEEILDLGEPGFFEIEDTNGEIIKEFVKTEKNSGFHMKDDQIQVNHEYQTAVSKKGAVEYATDSKTEKSADFYYKSKQDQKFHENQNLALKKEASLNAIKDFEIDQNLEFYINEIEHEDQKSYHNQNVVSEKEQISTTKDLETEINLNLASNTLKIEQDQSNNDTKNLKEMEKSTIVDQKTLKFLRKNPVFKFCPIDEIMKPFCTICKKMFTCNSSLYRHNSSVHELNRPFECEICKFRFTDKSQSSFKTVISK